VSFLALLEAPVMTEWEGSGNGFWCTYLRFLAPAERHLRGSKWVPDLIVMLFLCPCIFSWFPSSLVLFVFLSILPYQRAPTLYQLQDTGRSVSLFSIPPYQRTKIVLSTRRGASDAVHTSFVFHCKVMHQVYYSAYSGALKSERAALSGFIALGMVSFLCDAFRASGGSAIYDALDTCVSFSFSFLIIPLDESS
jgi:hypothetical protein